jgi:glycerol uptake facilitator-like aquaporin
VLRRLCAEGIGSVLLAAAVVGSGVMGERLSGGNAAIALLANTGATVAVLACLIGVFAPVSGAHFNPAVSLIEWLRGRLGRGEFLARAAVQITACIAGVALAHAMFGLPLLQLGAHARAGVAQWLSEFVATAGLLLVILGRSHKSDAPWMIAAWIGGAYWFTASTSFANPAITIARSLTLSFAGIRPADVPAFVAAQLLGALAAWGASQVLFDEGVGRAGPASRVP